MRALTSGLLLAAATAGSCLAWTSPVLRNVCNSAADSGGTVVVHADCIDSIRPPVEDVALTVFYSTDNQEIWQQVPMSLIGQPGYETTFQCAFPAPDSGTIYYYVRGDNGTNFGTQSPFNSGDAWPVTDNLLAETALEGTGDTINDPDGEWLDLTSCAMGYSDGRFYARMTNHYNSWPIRGSVVGPWYLYSVGFWNSDAATRDTLGYAMVHVNILTFTDGLFELNRYESTYTRIGDIDIQTSGNRLIMRCDASDLAARPGFQPWPNQCGYLCGAKGDARSANLSLQSLMHDSTNSGRFYVDRTPRLVVGQNQSPVLSLSGVDPDTGTGATDFRFHVHYVDADTNLPVLRALIVDADTYDLVPNGHRYGAGVTYVRTLGGFEVGPHEFRFAFSDGVSYTSTAPDTLVVTGGGVVESHTDRGPAFSVEPNPFVDRVRFRFPRLVRAVEILDAAGRRVRTFRAPREFWDGRDSDGQQLPSGVYYLREQGGPLRRLLVKLGR
ncbi:hypothetical protein FJY68_08155 [candidate division WOR-3 bacterium]|uniref:T9SS type A sorting domain-containing protein n=1 Tax=candidate division WOR-3 bacterium TaxID=2052148 RepID=A0A937XHM8_UNCW3|nr:hypothetical protein [candidate division WOR-3 bacterium]